MSTKTKVSPQRDATNEQLEAFNAVVTALLPLSDEERLRVIRMVIAYFGL